MRARSVPIGPAALLLPLAGLLLACGDPGTRDDAPTAAAQDNAEDHTRLASLSDPRPVVVPGLDESTDWFGRVARLRLDPASGHLFAVDRFAHRVVEFTSDGRFVAAYGGRAGRGPEEVGSVAGFAFDASYAVLLDERNLKTLVYDRQGRFLRSLPSDHSYKHVMLRGGQVWLVPGGSGGLVDVRDPNGGPVRSVGDGADLPVRCAEDRPREDCARLQAMCGECRLTNVNDTLFVIAHLEESLLNLYDETGTLIEQKDFLREDPVIRKWREQDIPLLEEENAAENPQGRVRVEALKAYFLSFDHPGGTRLSAAVAPALPIVHEHGREYWILDLSDGQIQRYRYPRPTLGYAAVGGGPVYALDSDDGGIYELDIPGGAPSP